MCIQADSLLGARGEKEHATSRLNEFMAGWDGLISKEKHRIMVVGATNRPFDLDEAVVRRMPRRYYTSITTQHYDVHFLEHAHSITCLYP